MSARRERSKSVKLERILAAARAIFDEKGFETATTREIAEKADVGFGTLFLHAGDKGTLLMSLVNADLATLSDDAVSTLAENADLVDKIVAFFRSRYEYWSRDPSLSRAAFREMSARGNGVDLAVGARHSRIEQRLAALIQADNERLPAVKQNDPYAFAALFSAIYLGDVRRWLHTNELNAEAGISHLRVLIALAARGMSNATPRAAATRCVRAR